MKRILSKSALITLVSIAISLAIVALVLPAAGLKFNQAALLLSVLCPLVTAFPAAFLGLRGHQRLAEVHEELRAANGELAAAHSDLERAHRQLALTARIDKMTGLLNRENFFHAVEEARAAAPCGTGILLFVDADNFKVINDRFGHHAGDDALVAIARAIDAVVGTGGITGRIGGEEFAVFLPGVDADKARNAAEQVRRAVRRIDFRPAEGNGVPLSVSIGGAMHRSVRKLVDVMREADWCLYKAKRAGRNRAVFASEVAAAAA